MQIKVRVFAGIRDALGFAEQVVDAPAGARVEDVIHDLHTAFPAAQLSERRFSVAVNRVFVSENRVLNDGDELALIPPVSGG